MIKIAILGFGKVGQTLLNTIQTNPLFHKRFKVVALWNRSPQIFDNITLPAGIDLYSTISNLIQNLENIDLVVECSHPSIIQKYGLEILEQTNLFVSSPTAFANDLFYQNYRQKMSDGKHQCYLPLGASVGIWDVIRLDQNRQLKSLSVVMKKHPDSFKIKDKKVLKKMEESLQLSTATTIAKGNIEMINEIAPQNTNTMAIYALAASTLGFSNCTASLVADPNLAAHIVVLEVVTKGGLKLSLERDNPAGHGQVTGSATFGSFLHSLYHYDKGIFNNKFFFC